MDKLTPEQRELKPCPFCGSKAELFQRELFGSDHDFSKDNDNWDVRCSADNCYLVDGADWWLIKEQAILAWNTRTANTAEDELNHHCKECRDSWLFGQMTRPAQKEYTRQVGNQIALRMWDKWEEYRKGKNIYMAFPDWLQQEDEDETTNT